jgi:hypothetical protein
MEDVLVPLFGIIFIFGAPVAAWIISRVLAHRERMEMIRQGFVPPNDPRMYRNARAWQQGGPPPPPGVVPPPMAGMFPDAFYAQNLLRKGITLTMVGFALFIGLSFIGMRDGHMSYGPWLLGGLIPMFVGVAQIINAVINGARFPGSGSPSGFGPVPGPSPNPQPGPPPPPPPTGPYAWRPGPTPEIEKPDGT